MHVLQRTQGTSAPPSALESTTEVPPGWDDTKELISFLGATLLLPALI